MMRSNSSGKALGFVAMLIVGSVLALIAIGQVMQRAVQTQLESEAEYAAMHWASFMRDTVPGLEAAFAGEGFSPAAQKQLQQLRRATDVFRFRLFDTRGAQMLASDDLEHETPLGRLPLEEAARASLHRDAVAVRAAESRQQVVELRRLDEGNESKVYSNAYVPLLQGQRLIGVVQFSADQTEREHRIGEAFRGVALTVAALLIALAGVGMWHRLQRARLQQLAEERMKYLVQHDVLTGVLSRASFHEALQQAQVRVEEGGLRFAVLCIDLDRFKDVNHLLGPAGGDEILRAMARRLQQLQGGIEQLARLEGDQFAVLQTAIRDAEDVALLGKRIVHTLAQPYEVAGQLVTAGASVGAAVYGTDGRDRTELLHKAELALYRAKSGGRGVFSFYDPSLDEKVQARRIIARELRQALHADQLSLHYQPLYERDGRTLNGYEALVRWTHPERGPISPAEFIPIAEESELIEELGQWVLGRACREAAGWPPSLNVSVNLSARQFGRGDLVETVIACLDASGLPARRLELEITESLLMSNTEQVVQVLHRLGSLGVRIAMDDFGTGYSSLAYLWRFPFDKVKIDRAFTQHLDKDPKVKLIVRSIVTLAHSLGIRVNAEGVETDAQLLCLQENGCDELQGFLLGRPTPGERLQHHGAPLHAQPAPARASTDWESLRPERAEL